MAILEPVEFPQGRPEGHPATASTAFPVGSLPGIARLPAELATAPVAGSQTPAFKLAVKGLSESERQLLTGLVRVSQRRTPRLALVDDADASVSLADVVMIDVHDAAAMSWARTRPWLASRLVIWIDAGNVPRGHTALKRPVQWASLPMVIARAIDSRVAPAAHPSATPPRPAGADEAAAPAARAQPSILVVDDSLAVRTHLRSLLERRGFAVCEAADVHAALERMAVEHFDCVLMDVLMPEMDGYEGCRRIKAHLREAQAVPVVMLTSKSSPFDRIRGKMAGCDAYLTKPVDPNQLHEVLTKVTATAREQPAALRTASVSP